MRGHDGLFFQKRMCYIRNNVSMSLIESLDRYSTQKVESPRIRFVYVFFFFLYIYLASFSRVIYMPPNFYKFENF